MTSKVYSIVLMLGLSAAGHAEVDFARQVHPILTARCTSCHSGHNAQAGLSLNTAAEVRKAGKTLLLARITGEKPPRMPLSGAPLTAEETRILTTWFDEGAKASSNVPESTTWKALLAPRSPKPPREGHAVDAFLGTQEAQVINDRLFARRAYLDLWGLLPTPEQLRDFERDPNRQKLIERLLKDKENYAGHWISFWNDLLRNDDGVVYYGERKSVTAWLRRSLEENMPFDRFVATLLNPAKKGDPEGFILGVTWRGEVPASERPPLQAAQNSAQIFLGINLKCNSCHDSFISNWKLKDAYGLAAFFSPEPLEIVRCDAKTGEQATTKFLFPELGDVRPAASLEERRAEAARLFTLSANGRLARTLVNRYWKVLFGRGIVEPVDDMAAQPWNADLLDWLASDFASHEYDVKHLLRTLMTSKAYQMASVKTSAVPGPEHKFAGPQRRRMSAEQYADAIASLTGDWRFKPTNNAAPTRYVREWELKSTALTRALGRPVRDQVVTERLTQPTTLQAVELVNGQYLANWLHEAAQGMAGAAAPVPDNLYDSGVIRRTPGKVNIPLKGVKELHFLVENVDSYNPARVVPQWKDAVFVNGKKQVPLKELIGQDPEKLRLPARFTVDLKDKKFKRFQATVQVTKESTDSDVGPAIRFFLFDRKPEMRRLVRVAPDTPVAQPPSKLTPDTLSDRLYLHAFQRTPVEAERVVLREILGPQLQPDAVEDLLWMILQSPEFQYIE